MNNLIKRMALSGAALSAVAVLAVPTSAGATGHGHKSYQKTPHKVTICHRTNSVTNRYRKITISYNAFDGNKKNDHTHHSGPFAYSEEYARELKKNHIKWGDIVSMDKCEKKQHVKSHTHHNKKEDCKPEQTEEPKAPVTPADTPKEDRDEPHVLAASTDTPSSPSSKGQVLADTGVSAAASTTAALAIIAAVGAVTYLSRHRADAETAIV